VIAFVSLPALFTVDYPLTSGPKPRPRTLYSCQNTSHLYLLRYFVFRGERTFESPGQTHSSLPRVLRNGGFFELTPWQMLRRATLAPYPAFTHRRTWDRVIRFITSHETPA